MSNAKNYEEERIAESIGNATCFVALLKEYRKAPKVTRVRIYLDSMEQPLAKV